MRRNCFITIGLALLIAAWAQIAVAQNVIGSGVVGDAKPHGGGASGWCGLVPQGGIVNCWPMDTANTSSVLATDTVGGKNATLNNITLNGSGPTGSPNLNNAIVCNGSTSHGDTPGLASSTSPPRSAFSVVYWINPTGLGASGNQRIIANDHTGGADNNGISWYYAVGGLDMVEFVGNGTTSVNVAAPASTNTWTMMTVTYDGTTLTPYAGTTAGTPVTLAGPVATPTNALGFCYNPAYAGDFFGGMLAGIAVYNRALTSGEVTAINGL